MGPGATELDFDPGRPVGGRVVAPQFPRRLVDDPGAIAGRVTGVVLSVVGVAGDIGPRQRARVQVANALVVREEVDPLAHPHGRGEVPVELVGAQQ